MSTTSGFTPPHYYLARQSPSHGDQLAFTGAFGANLAEQKTHLGIASCKLITHMVATYKCLKEVAIILKLFLAHYNLNSPYMGKYNYFFILISFLF